MNPDFNGIKQHLLSAPDSEIDASMMPLIEKWNIPPSSLQILQVIDECIYASLTSDFIVSILQELYNHVLKMENKTHEQNVPLATWRNGR